MLTPWALPVRIIRVVLTHVTSNNRFVNQYIKRVLWNVNQLTESRIQSFKWRTHTSRYFYNTALSAGVKGAEFL